MNVFAEVLPEVFSANQVTDLSNPVSWLLDFAGGRKTLAGTRVTPQSALSLSAYFDMLRILGEDTAKVPALVVMREEQKRMPLPLHHVSFLMNVAPNNNMTAITYRSTMVQWAAGWGGAVAEIERDGAGRPFMLHPIHPSRVEIRFDLVPDEKMFVIHNDIGKPTTLPDEDVFHLYGMGDGQTGYSLAQIGAESIGKAMAVRDFGSSFFGNGATLGSIISFPNPASETALKNFRKSWKEMHAGAKKAGSFAILQDGATHQQMSIPPDQAQWIQTMEFDVQEMARWGRLNPNKLGDWSRATFNNIEASERSHVDDALVPWFVRIEQETKRKLLNNPGEENLQLKHSIRALKQGDTKAQSELNTAMFRIGVFTQNIILESMDLNPAGLEGDVRYVEANMIPVSRLLESPVDDRRGIDRRAEADERIRTSQATAIAAAAAGPVRKEVKAVGAAIRKHVGKPEGFAASLEKFYAGHRAHILEAISPACHAMASLLNDTEDAHGMVTAIVERWVDKNIQDSIDAMLDAQDVSLETGEELLDSWTHTKAAQAGEELSTLVAKVNVMPAEAMA